MKFFFVNSFLKATAAGYDSPRSVPAIIPLPEINVPNETIVLDSESDVDQIVETSTSQVDMINDEVIIVSSSAETADNDSEIEILEHRIRPSVQFNCNLSIRDQPSTSTGIRDSSDRPNNRYAVYIICTFNVFIGIYQGWQTF